MAHGALPPISEYGPPRCSSCGSPTTVCEADQRVVLIGEDPARSQAGSIHRKRERTSATPDRGAGAAQLSPSQLVHCRRCSGEDVNADVDTPKPEGYRLPRASPSRRRARAFAFGVALPLLLLHLLICIVLSARERSLRWEPRPHGAAAGSLEVPHIIHQMYKTLDLPAKWAGVPGQWARLHPPSEYTYILWTDESLRELIATDYEWLLPTCAPRHLPPPSDAACLPCRLPIRARLTVRDCACGTGTTRTLTRRSGGTPRATQSCTNTVDFTRTSISIRSPLSTGCCEGRLSFCRTRPTSA